MSALASSPARPDFSGLWIPLVTPLRNGAVDHPALAALTTRLAAQGIAGFVVCGSTGEAAALDEHERLAVLDTVGSAAPGVPRVMGLGGEHLAHALDSVRRLAGRGLAALLVPAPSYIRPSQAGLAQWFTAIADASDVPLLVYDIPYRTGSTLARETLLSLAAHPRIVGVKDCSGDPAKVRALIADGRLQVLAGEDAQVLATMAEGGTGAIAASAHVHTPRWVRLVAALKSGRLTEGRALWQPLAPLVEALFAEPNPGPVKALLAASGEMTAELRAPMTGATPGLLERLRAIDAAIEPVER
ncbi:4-hydroxy-tetrahydrodipicolinate synthase [Xenophilus aerolatus]|nr:4-hydroxy-tetrahydrodipicolinate synthase [Xenophilus aerolatus]